MNIPGLIARSVVACFVFGSLWSCSAASSGAGTSGVTDAATRSPDSADPEAGGSGQNSPAEVPVPDIDLTSRTGNGSFSISGTATFPQEVPGGRSILLAFTKGYRPPDITFATQYVTATLGGARNKIAYSIKKLDAGKYVVFLAAEMQGNNEIGAGDLGGYYTGSGGVPTNDPQKAVYVEVGALVAGVDFSLSVLK